MNYFWNLLFIYSSQIRREDLNWKRKREKWNNFSQNLAKQGAGEIRKGLKYFGGVSNFLGDYGEAVKVPRLNT